MGDNNLSGDCVTLDEDEYCAQAWDASWKDLIGDQTFDTISEESIEFASEKTDLSMEAISDASFDCSSSSFSSLEHASLNDYCDEEEVYVVIDNDQDLGNQSSMCDKQSFPNDIEVIVKNDQYTPISDSEENTVKETLPIFASDGLISLKDDNIISVSGKYSISDVLKNAENVAIRFGGLNRTFWLSVGNIEATNCAILSDVQVSRWPKTIRSVVSNVMDAVKSFETKVKEAGGKIFLVTLLPCPKLVDPKVSIYSENLQKLSSRIFIQVNKEIKKFNNKNDVPTMSIHKYVEVKRRKTYGRSGAVRRRKLIEHKTSDFYKGRDQRKVNPGMFDGDNVHLSVEGMEAIVSALQKAIINEEKKKKEKEKKEDLIVNLKSIFVFV